MNHFIFLESYLDSVECLPEDLQLEVLKTICRYGTKGVEPEPGTIAAGILAAVKPAINAGKAAEEERKKAAKAAASARWGKECDRIPTHTDAMRIDAHACERMRTHADACDRIPTHTDALRRNADRCDSMPKEKEKVKEKVKDKRYKEVMSSAASVLDALNQSADRQFKAVDGTLKPIIARLREGRSEEECREIIRKKVAEWKGDPKMDAYLRPETLFSAQHFDSYLNAPEPKPTNRAPNKFHNFNERSIDYDAIIRGEEVG